MILKKDEIVEELAKRCGFYKKHTRVFVDELEGLVIEMLGKATLDENVELQFIKGFTIGSRRDPAYEAKDPRNQNTVIVPEKNVPYIKITTSFKNKISNIKKRKKKQ